MHDLVSEIGCDGFERCKIEFWSDGRVGYAFEHGASQDTALGDAPVPSVEEINSKVEFRAKEIDAAAFRELWHRHVLRVIECSVTFLPTSEGGRSSPLPPGAVAGDTYRPHLVIGDRRNVKPLWLAATS